MNLNRRNVPSVLTLSDEFGPQSHVFRKAPFEEALVNHFGNVDRSADRSSAGPDSKFTRAGVEMHHDRNRVSHGGLLSNHS